MHIIYLLSTFFLLSFGVLEGAWDDADATYLTIDGIEHSLDFSKKFPKLKYLTLVDESQYYLIQNDDLGLSKNPNLTTIFLYSHAFIPFFRNCYLPQVKEIYTNFWSGGDSLAAFPNLTNFNTIFRPSFEDLAVYTPHLQVIDMFETWFMEFSTDELNSIAKLSELREIEYRFNVAPENFKDIENEMQFLFPHVKIKLILNDFKDYDD